MRKIVLSGVATLGLLIVGTIVVGHPSNIRQADAAPACAAPHGKMVVADAGNANRAQRLLVADTSPRGAIRIQLVSFDGDSVAYAVTASAVVSDSHC